jgi:cytochrome c-type biogenesis protein CcmF
VFSLFGSLAILTGVASAGALMVQSIKAARSDESAERADLRPMAIGLLGSGIAAMVVLELALIFDDFTVSYVADNHSVTTPFPFNVATAWAALEGSIVLWCLVLSAFTWFVFRSHERNRDRLGAGALAVMALVSLFFFALMITVSNPFETCTEAGARSCVTSSPIPLVGADAPADGNGPNALLQNHILMAAHPPLLYVGYIGLTVPFAFAMSALAIGVPGPEWLRRSKRWTTISWSFLTLGIVLGGWWAYEVLSWGGYWAWDPVENASFMPWLLATAFLHSATVQQRRSMLQAWNFVLVIGAFALTILGTFLTRSGTIVSVHSFTQSAIGPVLLGFLAFVLVGSFTLFAIRAPAVAQPSRMDSLSSREGSLLYNNLILTVYAFVVLVGTIYPMILEAFNGDLVRVGPPFYNRLAVPISFALLLGMGIGPVMPWRVAKPELVWRRVHLPIQIALAAGAAVIIFSTDVNLVVVTVVLAVFLIAVSARHLLSQASHAAKIKGSPLTAEVRRMFGADPGYWGGQVSHAGVALVAIGIATASLLASNTQVTMAPGDSVEFAGYTLTYETPFVRTEPQRTVSGATIVAERDGAFVTELRPRQNVYPNFAQPVGTPEIHSTIGGDLYVTLRRLTPEGIVVDLDTSPMMWLVWLGGLVTVAGGFISAQARTARKRAEVAAGV